MDRKTEIDALWARVKAQKSKVPSIYGRVDFSSTPKRFANQPDDISSLPKKYEKRRQEILRDPDMLEFIRAYTFMGDRVADAYAALMGEYGFRNLVAMLVKACDEGIEAVPDAPPELKLFIEDMERVPDWLDMELIEEGARQERNTMANFSPFVIRGALFATFLNSYSALPMAVTNTLSSSTAARRIKETSTFFTVSTLPGALDRFGAGFHAAAMVRLMHSMVRANIMRKPGDWDIETFGIPVPQVDQMPAGLFGVYLMSIGILGKGRETFTPEERARVEFSRYRCFLLGLPEDLLADTPRGIVDLMMARDGTLLRDFDNDTCGALVRATMAADLKADQSLSARIHEMFERAVSKQFLLQNFMAGKRYKSSAIGVDVTIRDTLLAIVTITYVQAKMRLHDLCAHIPVLRQYSDKRLIRKLERQLARYGHANFTTDASQYKIAATA